MPQYIVTCANPDTGDEYEVAISAASAEAARLAALREGRLVGGVRAAESNAYDPLAPDNSAHASPASSDPYSADRLILHELLNALQELRLIRRQLERGVRVRWMIVKVAIGVAFSLLVWPIIWLIVTLILGAAGYTMESLLPTQLGP